MTPEAAQAVREGLALFALCWLLARAEIEIEGPHGWAVDLPTWRWGPEWWLKLTNGKEVTGYHVWLSLFLIGAMHLPLVFAGFSRALFAKCLSSYFLLTFTWDLQWFAWNPAWGLAAFRSRPIPWFRRKLFGFPVDYYGACAASAFATRLIWSPGLSAWLVRFATLAIASSLSLIAASRFSPAAANAPISPGSAADKAPAP
jgi:hypothetical protein